MLMKVSSSKPHYHFRHHYKRKFIVIDNCWKYTKYGRVNVCEDDEDDDD